MCIQSHHIQERQNWEVINVKLSLPYFDKKLLMAGNKMIFRKGETIKEIVTQNLSIYQWRLNDNMMLIYTCWLRLLHVPWSNQAITWTFREIWITIQTHSVKQMYWKFRLQNGNHFVNDQKESKFVMMTSKYTEWWFLLDIYIWSIYKYPYSNSTHTAWHNPICELIMTALDTPYHDCEVPG